MATPGTLDLVSLWRASLLVPLPPDLSASLPPEFCPLPFVCFLCGTRNRTFMRKHYQLEKFINHYFIHILPLHGFLFWWFLKFCGFHQDPHTAVRSKPDHLPLPLPPPSKHIAAKNMTSTTVIT